LALAQPEELREVLLNLLENARLASAHTVMVTVVSQAERVLVLIQDDGHGVPPEVLAQVFEPHFSTRTSGSGLGLAICRRLVESWGGRIALESSAGAGTVVQVTLLPAPLAPV
jgi:signal transduction histidine kinase